MNIRSYFLGNIPDVYPSWHYCSLSSLEKTLPCLGHCLSLPMWVVWQGLADNIQSSLLLIHSEQFHHCGCSVWEPSNHCLCDIVLDLDLFWNNRGHAFCCYCNYSLASLLQLSYRVQAAVVASKTDSVKLFGEFDEIPCLTIHIVSCSKSSFGLCCFIALPE